MDKYTYVSGILSEKSKTWLVTGVAGFIGSHLLHCLLSLDQAVIGIDNFITGKPENLEDIKSQVSAQAWSRFQFIKGDIRDAGDCRMMFAQPVDYVLHQAALGSVPRSIKNPMATNDHNVNGFLKVLWHAKEAGVKSFVFASSSSVYGDNAELPKVESRIGNALSPYAVSKRADELYAQVFHDNHGLRTIGLRYFNVFGPRQDPNGPYAAVIPLWIASMLRGEQIFINGDGLTSRDFSYVANTVRGNILAATCEDDSAFGQVYNIACNSKTTLNELFGLIRNELGATYHSIIKETKPQHRDFRPGDVRHSLADVSKAERILGYRPSHTIREGLNEAMPWYVTNAKTRPEKASV